MVNLIDNALLEQFYTNPSLKKSLSISYGGNTIGMSDIALESLELDESLCTEQVLTFGACETSELRLRIKEQQNSLLGEKLILTMNVEGYDPIRLGEYEVHSYTLDNTRSYRDIIAHDSMYQVLNTDVASWYNGLEFPLTLKAFRDSFFSNLGIEQVETSLLNDDLIIEKTIEVTEFSGKQVINAICEINGCFGHINRNGLFDYIILNDNNDSINVLRAYYEQNSVICQDYMTDSISKLQIRAEQGDIGAIAGTGDNSYIIENNFLVFGLNADQLGRIADKLFNLIRYITYRPFTASRVLGNPCVEVGDRISIKGTTATVNTYVLSRSLSGIQALYDSFYAEGMQQYPEQVNSLNKQIMTLRGKTNVLERTVEMNRLTITDLTADVDTLTETTSTLTQTSNSLEARITTAEKRLDNEVETYEVDYEPTLYNAPAIDWTTNIPVDGTVAVTDDLHFEYTDQDYLAHLGYPAYSREMNTMYRFTKNTEEGGFYWKPVVNSDMSYVMSKVSELQITVDGIQTEVSATYETKSNASEEYQRLESTITQTEKSIRTDVSNTYQTVDNMKNYSTKEETRTSIEQSANSIESSVSAKYQTINGMAQYSTTSEMNSAIRQSADSIESSVSSTYQTKEGMKNYTTVSQMNSAIKQSADSVSISAAKSSNKWDRKGLTFDLYGFGTPDQCGFSASDYRHGTSYFDELNGAYYFCVTSTGSTSSARWEKQSTKFVKISDEQQAQIKVNSDNITSKVSKNNVVSEINQSSESIKIKAEKLELTGLVTISALKGSGTTEINGDNIKAGTISAINLNGCSMTGCAASFGNNNIILNEGGFWVGANSNGTFNCKIDNTGNVSINNASFGNNSVIINPGGISANAPFVTSQAILLKNANSQTNDVEITRQSIIAPKLYVNGSKIQLADNNIVLLDESGNEVWFTPTGVSIPSRKLNGTWADIIIKSFS